MGLEPGLGRQSDVGQKGALGPNPGADFEGVVNVVVAAISVFGGAIVAIEDDDIRCPSGKEHDRTFRETAGIAQVGDPAVPVFHAVSLGRNSVVEGNGRDQKLTAFERTEDRLEVKFEDTRLIGEVPIARRV